MLANKVFSGLYVSFKQTIFQEGEFLRDNFSDASIVCILSVIFADQWCSTDTLQHDGIIVIKIMAAAAIGKPVEHIMKVCTRLIVALVYKVK